MPVCGGDRGKSIAHEKEENPWKQEPTTALPDTVSFSSQFPISAVKRGGV